MFPRITNGDYVRTAGEAGQAAWRAPGARRWPESGGSAGQQQPRICRADAAPHDGRRPGRGQEGAGCQRRFPVRTARSMDCSSEPGVIAAGLPAASFARRGRAGADRSHRAVPSLRRQLRSLGRHARAAQTVTTFISNAGQASNTVSGSARATAFTTGGNTGGYGLTSVDLPLATLTGSFTPRVEIFRNDATDRPGTRLATLINPATVTQIAGNTFNAPPNTTLTANTPYWLVVSNDAAADGDGIRVKTAGNATAGNATADTGAAMGWSIGNALWKNDIRNASWSASSSRIIFAVKGTAVGGTTNTAATGAPTITGSVRCDAVGEGLFTAVALGNGPRQPHLRHASGGAGPGDAGSGIDTAVVSLSCLRNVGEWAERIGRKHGAPGRLARRLARGHQRAGQRQLTPAPGKNYG